jgi:hypothetical protein
MTKRLFWMSSFEVIPLQPMNCWKNIIQHPIASRLKLDLLVSSAQYCAQN